MIYLQLNTPDQQIIVKLQEMRKFFPAFTHYLVTMRPEVHNIGQSALAQVVPVVAENPRYTAITVTTASLTYDGRYYYEIFGQNSSTNVDPDNAAVVGKLDQGLMVISADAPGFIEPTYTPEQVIEHD
jgi:uncharacterized protein (DUF885 family)